MIDKASNGGAALPFTLAEPALSSVPEPASIAILGLGLLGLAGTLRRKS